MYNLRQIKLAGHCQFCLQDSWARVCTCVAKVPDIASNFSSTRSPQQFKNSVVLSLLTDIASWNKN